MPDEPVHIGPEQILESGQRLLSRAEKIRALTGGVDRAVPDVPYDWYGLHDLVRQLDEAREAFDQRLATLIARYGLRAIDQVLETQAKDRIELILR